MGSTLFKNSSPNGWIVQKFGGTSVGKFPDKIAEDIVRYVSDSHLALGSVGGSAAAVRRRPETEGGTKQGRDEDADLFFFLPAQDTCSEQPAGGGMLSPQHRQEGDGYHKQVSGQDAHPSLNPRVPPPPPHHVGGTGDAAMSSAPAISQVFAGASRDGG